MTSRNSTIDQRRRAVELLVDRAARDAGVSVETIDHARNAVATLAWCEKHAPQLRAFAILLAAFPDAEIGGPT